MNSANATGPAYRIRTPRLVLRCWNAEDAPLLMTAITASLDHLRAWMPWAHHEPESIEAKTQRLRDFHADFEQGRDFIYGIFSPDESQVLGGTGLHPRLGEGAREIGYWIHADHAGQGYATEAAAALIKVAFEVENLRRVEIHCDPNNSRSAAVPRRLGFTHEATLQQSVDGTPRDVMIWRLLRENYDRTPAIAIEIEAFDALGQRLL
ncbi:MAG TPA: GNAT family protein [Steroidobacter sp.]|uniref:GNAT family N-acetyltransferase n=1 Tax=Steroidobacter sp. TaxID=1978227 RepID=UPI002ED80FBE